MWVREAYFRWLLPAAFVLPLWILVGWAVFGQSAWALLWVLLMAMPSVFAGQLALTLLTRSRPSVRAARAVSWWDVAGFSVWHGLTIAVAFFIEGAFPWLLTLAIAAVVALFWMQIRQLWNESRAGGLAVRETVSWRSMRTGGGVSPDGHADVIVIEEKRSRP